MGRMGKLDETSFAATIATECQCGAKAYEVASYIDRQLSIMLGDRNDDGRWTHDGEKFVDGIYRIRCLNCSHEPFETSDCPRCHRAGGLGDALGVMSRLAIPKRC